ncbi:hypothetical protein KKE34_04725 [Patescibacteria group bacterium]|nr:hypothetical protein [Patescibacteria group bacterium]
MGKRKEAFGESIDTTALAKRISSQFGQKFDSHATVAIAINACLENNPGASEAQIFNLVISNRGRKLHHRPRKDGRLADGGKRH